MGKLYILISRKDPASENVGYFLRKKFDLLSVFDVELVEIERMHLYLKNDDIKELGIKGEILVLSSHASERKIKSLTVHTPGNFGENLYGGEPEKISLSNPILQTVLLRSLQKNNPFEEFQVSLEVTHHGPSLDVPVTYYEIGSSEEEWRRKDVGEFMARNLIEAIPRYFETLKEEVRICSGVGGPHYAPNFTRFVLRNEEFFIGHIMPKYAFNQEMIEDIFKRNFPREADTCVIDWKGLRSEERRILMRYCCENGISVKRI